MPVNPFDDERLRGARSALVKVTPDEQGRYVFDLWCQYTRAGLDAIQVGDLVAVENYTQPDGDRRTYSVLTLTQVYPVHFAAQGSDAYPGHVFESMRSIREDWEKQVDRPLHPTTTILAKAVSTGWQFQFQPLQNALSGLADERNLPMTGAEIRPLGRNMVEAIINQGIAEESASPFTHKKFTDLNIRLDVRALLTTHFGIFGFTGVGKSNAVSSLVSALTQQGAPRRANVVLFDPNDEYLGLLIDKFVTHPEEMLYIHVGTDSLAVPITQQLGAGAGPPTPEIVEMMRQQLRLPARLAGVQALDNFLRQGIANALPRTRIALPEENMAACIRRELSEQTDPRSGPAAKEALREAEDLWTMPFIGQPITVQTVHQAVAAAQPNGSPVRQAIAQRVQGPQAGTAMGALDRAIRALQRLEHSLDEIPPDAIIPIADLVTALNDPVSRRIVIITGRRDSDIKRFGEVFGNEMYEARRQIAQMEPFTTFIFDEADLFLPLEGQDEATSGIKDFCVTLARRGRKFGLGIGISTQRASLLDTEVMANLHTYFVSKLPRAHDRLRVAEAFGIGDQQLSPTFTFRPGDWLIISHDATGLKGVPIPSSALDANRRILDAAHVA